jgi:hypothetical protein
MKPIRLVPTAAALLLGACVTMPTGPGVMALPGSSKTFDQFQTDDYACRDYAYRAIGGQTSQQAANNSAVTSAVVGTAIGAAAGAAFGGSQGAAVGAGSGLLFGSAVGTSTSYASGTAAQFRYDDAYTQCMYAKGNRVPVSGAFAASQPATRYSPQRQAPQPAITTPPATRTVPPPPEGLPPPPPPR